MRVLDKLIVCFLVSLLLLTIGYSQEQNHVKLCRNKALAEQMTKSNTVYKIWHTFDLDGDTLVIPEECVLKFGGGKIINGTIVLNDTYLEGYEGFQNVVLTGKCSNSILSSDLFVLDKKGVVDNSVDVQSLFNVGVDSIVFSKGTYSFSDIQVGNVSINANGATFVSTLAAEGFSVISNIFVASNTDYFKLYDATIKGHLEGNPKIQKLVLSPVDLTNVNNVEFRGCVFKELRISCYKGYAGGLYDYRGVSFSCHGCKDVLIENCEFYDLGPSEWTWIAPAACGTWDDVEMVRLRNNHFHNPEDDYERSNSPVNVFSNSVIFEGNRLEYQKYAGSAFNLQSRKVIAHDNVVRHSYFKSIIDVCEYEDFCNDYVEIYNNDFSAYNSQSVVANAKELYVRDNIFEGLSAVLAYATYHDPKSNHAACVDYATETATPNQKVIIEGNNCNCDYIDTTWKLRGMIVHGGYCSGITIQSLYCISDSIKIKNNRLHIRKVESDKLGSTFIHQPVYIRNTKNIDVNDNRIDSDIPAVGSSLKGAIYILVYNRDRERDAKMTEIESLDIVNNTFNIISDSNVLYTIRISGYSENTTDWIINKAKLSGNVLSSSTQREQIYTTGGRIDKLIVDNGGKMDIKNSPAKINRLNGKEYVNQ